MIYVKVENEVNKISFRFWKRYAVSSYLICNRVTLTFPFFTTTTFHSYIEGKYEVEIRDRFVKEVNKSLKLPLTTTSTPLTNLVLSLLRSSVSSVNCRLTKVCWSLPKVWRKYKITIIIHEMTLDLTFSSLHAASSAKFAISLCITLLAELRIV